MKQFINVLGNVVSLPANKQTLSVMFSQTRLKTVKNQTEKAEKASTNYRDT